MPGGNLVWCEPCAYNSDIHYCGNCKMYILADEMSDNTERKNYICKTCWKDVIG